MIDWPEFEKHPRILFEGVEHAILCEEEYNQARDAIAWQQKAREIYPNIAAYIDERMAPPQPTGE